MRRVQVSEYQRSADGLSSSLVDIGEAIFHQFGSNYEEFESGPGNFTTAVIEWPDGKIGNVPVEHIRFLEATQCTTTKK